MQMKDRIHQPPRTLHALEVAVGRLASVPAEDPKEQAQRLQTGVELLTATLEFNERLTGVAYSLKAYLGLETPVD